ncbi:MAG: helix-turn-helix transcriptional regulator [Bacteroidetes bacterium]|nr:helix-turn-helix transcriptional regulator [Bacteroidota bacterium]
MGDLFTIPTDLFAGEDCTVSPEKIGIRIYESSLPSTKSRVTITNNLFSFLLEGEKLVHRPGKPLRVFPGQFLMIASSNCLMTEKLSSGNRYHSLLFFFNNEKLRSFFTKYPSLHRQTGKIIGCGEEPIVCFETDAFIQNYLHSLQLLLKASTSLQEELLQLKLEELLLYLADKCPEALFSFQLFDPPGPHNTTTVPKDATDRQLQAAVENNLTYSVTVEELAFLCNMSMSTFKRRFARIYGTSPNKWLLQRRMQQAVLLLQQQAKPSEIYFQLGYENHSSFTQSFKQAYGITPREFQKNLRAHPDTQANDERPPIVFGRLALTQRPA